MAAPWLSVPKLSSLLLLSLLAFLATMVVLFRPTSTFARPLREVPNATFVYSINSARGVCDGKELVAIMYIFTAPDHFSMRSRIRCTWASPGNYSAEEFAYFFILGTFDNANWSARIGQEAATYSDIVQSSLPDKYLELVYKDIAAYWWIMQYCSRAKFVIKLDDDVFVSLPRVITQLRAEVFVDTIRCVYIFRHEKHPRCSGPAYVVPTAWLRALLTASQAAPFFWAEDVYFTMTLRKAVGLEIANFAGDSGQKMHFSNAPLLERLNSTPFVFTQRTTETWPECWNNSRKSLPGWD